SRETLHFNDVAVLTFEAAGHGVDSVLGVLAKRGLAGTEQDFRLVLCLVLVDVGDHGLNSLDAGGSLLGGLLRRGGLVAGLECVLVGGVGAVRGQFDASLGAGVSVSDGLAVAGGQLIEFVDA